MEITFQSEERIEDLKRRTRRCVCKYCGGKLKLRRIIFNDIDEARVEIFCRQCDRIEYGVEPEIYRSARYFVEELDFNCYPDLDDNDRTRQMTIAKVSEIMAWENKNLGFLGDDGFEAVVKMNMNLTGESILLTDEDLDDWFDEDING